MKNKVEKQQNDDDKQMHENLEKIIKLISTKINPKKNDYKNVLLENIQANYVSGVLIDEFLALFNEDIY